MKRALLIALVVLGAASPADAQPVLGGGGWRPPGPCSTGQTFIFNGTIWTCGSPGGTITGASGAVLKSDGAGNAVASSWTDNGTTTSTTASTVLGNAEADTLDVNGNLSKFGTGEGDGSVYLYRDQLNFEYATNATAAGAINWSGYQAGATQFRDLIIGDGKNATACQVTGSTKTLNCIGGLQVNGTSVLAGSGTNGRSLRQSGGAITTGAFTDDGTNATAQGTFATLGNFTAGDSKSIDTTTINGALTQEETSGTRHAVVLARTPTNATSGTWQTVKVNTAGTFDTSGGAISSTGLSVNSTSTRATGGNALTNIALISTATGGQSNRALQTNDGDVLLNASSGTTTIGGALTANSTATITGLLTATAGVTTPANLTTTGTGDLVSGDDLTVADAATIGGDVTINRSAGTSPTLFWKQSGQVDWKIYGVASSNTLNIWNSSSGTVIGLSTGAITLSKATTASSTFNAQGAADFDSTVNVDGQANLNGGAVVTGDLDVTGATTANDLTVEGSGHVGGDLGITGLLEPTGGMLVENTATMTEAVTIGDDPSDPLTVNSTTTFNGPVFGLDGPGVGNGGWEGSHIEWWDEFMRAPASPGEKGMQGLWQYGANNSGTCTKAWATSANHPGTVLLTPSATGGSCSYDWGTDRNVTFHSGETWTAEAGIELTELADGTSGNDGTLIFGFASDATAATINQTNGCYFAYDDRNHLTGAVGALNAAKWECWCASGGARTKYIMDGSTVSDGSFTTVNTPVSALDWDHLKLVVTGTTKAEFYVDGVKSCQITSNIPTNSLGPIFRNVNSSATGTDITYIIDFVRYFVDLATARGN